MAARLLGRLGSIAGVLVADYWFVRKKKLASPISTAGTGAYARRAASRPASREGEPGRAPRGRAVNPSLLLATPGCLLAWIGLVKPLARSTITRGSSAPRRGVAYCSSCGEDEARPARSRTSSES